MIRDGLADMRIIKKSDSFTYDTETFQPLRLLIQILQFINNLSCHLGTEL